MNIWRVLNDEGIYITDCTLFFYSIKLVINFLSWPWSASHWHQANFCFNKVQMHGSYCSSRMASLSQQRCFRFFEKICFAFFQFRLRRNRTERGALWDNWFQVRSSKIQVSHNWLKRLINCSVLLYFFHLSSRISFVDFSIFLSFALIELFVLL